MIEIKAPARDGAQDSSMKRPSQLVAGIALGACLAIMVASGRPLTAADEAFNVHDLFEERCGDCHGHAGSFARERLVIVDGVLRSRGTDADIADFLPTHLGLLDADEAAAVHDLFLGIVEAGGLYELKCRMCHARARVLARARLIIEGDRLVGRYSGIDVATFLKSHGRLSPEEADLMTRRLFDLTESRRAPRP